MPLLTFEQFIAEDSSGRAYNNFPVFFIPNSLFDEIKRGKPYFLHFSRAHPDLEAHLTREIPVHLRKTGCRDEKLRPLERDLYTAYQLLRAYGATDAELFA